MQIDTQLLAILIGVLYAISAGLILISLIRHRLGLRHDARHAALIAPKTSSRGAGECLASNR